MGRCTSPPAAVVVGAVEVFNIVISLIEMEVQIMTTVRTDQKSAEHIPFTVFGFPPADLATLFLNLFPDHTINNRLMHVFEDHPVFPVIGNPLLVFVGFEVGLEIQHISAILLQSENIHDGGGIPLGRWLLFCLSGLLDTLFQPIGARSKDSFFLKNSGNLLRSIPVQNHTENSPNYLCGFFIDDPVLRILRVLHVAKGGWPHWFPGIALDLIADPALFADVPRVPLVEQVTDGSKFIFAFSGIDVVRNRHKADIVLREEFFHQPPHFNVVSAQPGKVFDKQSGSPAFFQLAHHFIKAGTIHGNAGNTVVNEGYDIGIAHILGGFGQ